MKKNKAIFLDRDGVLNKKREDYVKSIKELEIFPNIQKVILELKKRGFLIIVITNQSVINRGIITIKELEKIHLTIQKYLEEEKTKIDKFYFCPHRPNENCDCRKPKPGLILEAINEFSIDASKSWMIGDSITDIQAGKKAGCKTIFLKKNDSLIKILKIIESQEKQGQTSK
ncbi:MAG: HAD family hydrolase [Nitrosopumilus sp.]|nr:HAD family hydrolase [Nitrosopumilus sp.]